MRHLMSSVVCVVTAIALGAAAIAAPVDGTGATYGVYGQCTATTAYGYLGYTRFGIYAWTPTTDGVALYGIASSATGTTRGIYGRTASNAGTAVYALATSTTGATRGVDAQCASDAAIGVYGYAYSATGATKGVYGRVASTSGTAVYAQATAATGTTYGVYGKVTSGDGWAGYFEGGNGLYASGFKMPFGHTAGYVLTSDANGVGTWQAVPAGGGGWALTGNAGTTPGTNYLGTTDNQALQFHVNSARAFRIEPHATSPNIVGGHAGNSVSVGAYGCTIAGGGITGDLNKATDPYCTVGGGVGNVAGNDDADFTIDDADSATVAGGWDNTASSCCSTVSGGEENTASGDTATIGGGEDNTASGSTSTIGGGEDNTASGAYSTIPGGLKNTASGDYSFAAGRQASATHAGSLVWADSYDEALASTAANRFHSRAIGGYYLYTAPTKSAGVYIGAGGGSWSSVSDRDAKQDFAAVQPKTVLDKLVAVPVSTWAYKASPAVQHMGPMAQDLHAAFALGDSDRAITTIDGLGISMAAIQGLNQVVAEKEARIQALEQALAAKDSELEDVKDRLKRIETTLDALPAE